MAQHLHPGIFSGQEGVPFEKTYTLDRSISAIPILPGAYLSPQLGLVTRLPEGAELDLRGPGFDDHTLRVHWRGQTYFVFLDELEPQRKRAASAVAG